MGEVPARSFCPPRCVTSASEILRDASSGPVAQWIRHRPTEPGIVGSSPTGVMHSLEPQSHVLRFSTDFKPQLQMSAGTSAVWVANASGLLPNTKSLNKSVTCLLVRSLHPGVSLLDEKILRHSSSGPVAQWIRHRSTEPGIVGPSPTGVMHSRVPHSHLSASPQIQITAVDVYGDFSGAGCKCHGPISKKPEA